MHSGTIVILPKIEHLEVLFNRVKVEENGSLKCVTQMIDLKRVFLEDGIESHENIYIKLLSSFFQNRLIFIKVSNVSEMAILILRIRPCFSRQNN